MRRVGILLLCGLGSGWLAGCASSEVVVAHTVDLVPAAQEIPEERLLDVGIRVFDPGVPEGEVDKEVLEELIRAGTFVHIRRTEARYMAVELRDTLRNSGHWGAVWVTPWETMAADVNVSAEILQSDGDQVHLQVKAVDAAGRVWLDDRYELETAAGAYNRQRYPELDPYQDLFNSIANDLSDVRAQLSAQEAEELRRIAELRFATELSPAAFDGYVDANGRGIYELSRLPAVDDPMFDRTQRIRQREHLFIETLNEHYDEFHQEALESYDGWRQYAREEAIAVRDLTRSARWRTGLGIATVIASVVYGSQSGNDSFSDRVVRDALMYVGMDVIRSASVRRQEKRLHTEALEELSESFDDEVKPLVVEIEGTQHRLTGTAEIQYQEWRQLLRELFIAETGFVPEMDIYAEPDPEPLLETMQQVGPERPAEPSAEEGGEAAEPAEEVTTDATEGAAGGA